MMNKKTALTIVAGLSEPSKMPCYGYSISAKRCKTGSKLAKVPGSVCSKCYAMRGNYRFAGVVAAHEKRYEAMLTNPQWVEAMAWLINNVEVSGHFRWFDSGDIQSVDNLTQIVEVCKLTPGVKHWLPTREYSIVSNWVKINGALPANLILRLSALMLEGQPPSGIAARLGVLTSGVSKTSFTCPAANQGNECLACRACWDTKVANVNYKRH